MVLTPTEDFISQRGKLRSQPGETLHGDQSERGKHPFKVVSLPSRVGKVVGRGPAEAGSEGDPFKSRFNVPDLLENSEEGPRDRLDDLLLFGEKTLSLHSQTLGQDPEGRDGELLNGLDGPGSLS
jgi:hypothetical protein